MLRTQIQLQSAEIAKLQAENQKLQVMVLVKYLLFLFRQSFVPVLSVEFVLNQACFKHACQKVIPTLF